MKQPTSKTQIKLNDQGAKDLYEIYRVLQQENPYLKVSWSELLSEIVTTIKENYLEKEAQFLRLKFFDKNSYLKQAALNDVPEDDILRLLQERQVALQSKSLKPKKSVRKAKKDTLEGIVNET